jgi:tetratricopeptide (TPR) repeat protein
VEVKSGAVIYTTSFDAPQHEPDEMQDEILGAVGNLLTTEINKLSYPYPLDTVQKRKAVDLASEARSRVDRAEDSASIIKEFEDAIALDAGNVDIIGWYANALVAIASNNGHSADPQGSELKKAKSLLDQGEKIAPYHRIVRYGRNQYYRIAGNPQAALIACEATRRILPWEPRIHKEMGGNFLLLGLLDDALRAYQAADRLQKTGAVRWTWFWGAGLASLLANHNQEAVTWLTKASALRTSDPWIHAMLAVAYRRLGDPAQAEREHEAFDKLNPPTSVDDFIANNFPPSIDYNIRLRDALDQLRREVTFTMGK